MISEEKLSQIVDKMVDKKRIFSAVLKVENSDGSFSWTGSAGDMDNDSKYFIASVTKLYITTIVLRLIEENKISFEDKITQHLPPNYCENIHVLKGIDYSDRITIWHLITNTSGIPDYFFHKQESGKTVADSLMEGNDEPWPLDKSIKLVRNLNPKFKPGEKGKVAYSDTNYQLLGKIIEAVTQKSMGEVFQAYIFSKLNIPNTYAYHDVQDTSPVPFYYKSKKLWLPEYIASVTPEGGIISTASEVMIYLKSFFNGTFFPKEKIDTLKKWNLLFPPPGLFYFGVGLEKFWIPWIISPLRPVGDILGFWGQTGSFAFYNSKTDLFFTGTTNQIDGTGHRVAGSAIFKVIKSAL